MHTVTDFITIVNDYPMERFNKTVPGHSSIIDIPVPDKCFTGRDGSGRVFINLPLVVKTSDGKKHYETIVVFQRYTNRQDIFALGTTTDLIKPYNLLGNRLNNLDNITRLLDGKIIRLFNAENYLMTFDTAEEIEIYLDRPSVFQLIRTVFREIFA